MTLVLGAVTAPWRADGAMFATGPAPDGTGRPAEYPQPVPSGDLAHVLFAGRAAKASDEIGVAEDVGVVAGGRGRRDVAGFMHVG
jgi:hypothetical protein